MQTEQVKKDAVQNLKRILPHLESEGESVRRCFGAIIENFHVSGRRLAAIEKTGVIDEAVVEFLNAAQEISTNLERLLVAAQMIESATNEMAKGAQDLAQGRVG